VLAAQKEPQALSTRTPCTIVTAHHTAAGELIQSHLGSTDRPSHLENGRLTGKQGPKGLSFCFAVLYTNGRRPLNPTLVSSIENYATDTTEGSLLKKFYNGELYATGRSCRRSRDPRWPCNTSIPTILYTLDTSQNRRQVLTRRQLVATAQAQGPINLFEFCRPPTIRRGWRH
jgi:hypothetical protein